MKIEKKTNGLQVCMYISRVSASLAFYSALGPGPDEASKLILIDSHLTNEVLNPLARSICIRYTRGSSSEFVAFHCGRVLAC